MSGDRNKKVVKANDVVYMGTVVVSVILILMLNEERLCLAESSGPSCWTEADARNVVSLALVGESERGPLGA